MRPRTHCEAASPTPFQPPPPRATSPLRLRARGAQCACSALPGAPAQASLRQPSPRRQPLRYHSRPHPRSPCKRRC
eukprot:2698836-Pleurochrysis_carterae.AAC.1